jgi:hypothetical protein
MSILSNSDIATKIGSEYANNTNEGIKPLTHRTVHGDMNDSKINVQFGNYFRGPVLSTGTANVYAVTLTNQYPTVYTQNIPLLIKINISNTGASTLNVNGLGALAIQNPDTSALVSGQLVADKHYFVNYTGSAIELMDITTVSGVIANSVLLDDTSLVVADTTNLQTFAELADEALLRARGTGIATSYVSSVSVGGTTFAQPTVKGEITSDEGYFKIVYAGATGITVADLSATSTWVYIDKTGALQQQTTTPTRQDRTRKAFTMRIGVDTSTNQIINFEYENNPIGHYANSLRDLYEFLLIQGVPFKKDQIITGRTDNLGFDVSAGQLLEFGGTGDINNPNIKDFDAVANTAYNLMSRTAVVSSETNLVKFWDNAETITPLGSTTCVGHRVYRFSSGNFAIQYGQGNYANMTLAKAGVKLEEYVLNPALKDATFFGWWLLEETATATSGTVDAEFVEYTLGVQGGSSSGLSGALLKGNNLSDLLDAPGARTNLGLGSSAVAALIDDDTFATATATNIPSAESVKAYVDTSAVGVVFEGEELATTATTFTFIATGVTTAPGDIYNIETTCFVDAANIRFDRVTTMIISATGAQNDSYSVIARGSTATYGISPSTDAGVLNLDFVSMTGSTKNLKVKVTKLFAG